MTAAITIKQLSKSYKEKKVLNDVNLTINEGELFGLLGVNGAGKTTLIHILSGLLAQNTGEVELLGYTLPKERNQIKKYIAVSPQETAIAPNLTVRENLEFMAGIQGYSKKEMRVKINELLTTFSFQPYEKQKSKTLSGGWKRKLSIALALISEPKILFLDEPTLGLDILGRRELWSLIEKLKAQTTIILTTHYLEEAEALCDRICILKDGHVKAVGTSQELIDQARVTTFEDAFVEIVTKGDA